MHNDLLKIGPVTIHGYGLMIAIGSLVALWAGIRLAKRKGLNPDALYTITALSLIGGFACAKVLFIIVDWKTFIADPLTTLGSDGFVIYGGIIGAIFIDGLYCKIKKLSFWDYFDIVLPAVAIAQGFGRIGCFLAGCCYGLEMDTPISIVFHDSDFAPNGVPLLPTQLMSSAGCFIMAAILIIYYIRKDRKPGTTGALYLIIYSIGRAIIEFFRNDHRGAIGPLSTSQFISIFILIAGIVIFAVKSKTTVEVKEVEEVIEDKED